MRTMSYTEPRARYAETLDSVGLLRNPANARRLLASIERLEAGGGQARELSE